MDQQRFLNACRMRDASRFSEAYTEFSEIAEGAEDPVDRVEALLYALKTLEISGQYEAAAAKLEPVRALIRDASLDESKANERLISLKLYLDFEEANLCWLRDQHQVALTKFEAVLGDLDQKPQVDSHDIYEAIQSRRAFILCDLGRWREAQPILEELKPSEEFREGIAFYLGHCYLAADDYVRAEQKLAEALRIGGLPGSLEFRAHCELGMTYYNLGDYAKAKQELEKGAAQASPSYLKKSQVWKWLELTCRALGLTQEAYDYSRMAKPS